MNDLYARLSAWFSAPADASSLVELCHIIRSCEGSLDPVWHPLGFIHVKLAQGEMKDTFRMHVWSRHCREPNEQVDKIHDHLFDVRSRVVFGDLKNVRYRFSPSFSGAYREVRVDYGRNEVSLRESGIYGDLEEFGDEVLRAPVEYFVPKFELHQTLLGESDVALTIVHTTEPENYAPRAIFQRDGALPPLRKPVPCDRGVWQRLLREMLPL